MIGGTTNHAHLLVSLPAATPVSDAMRSIKCNTTTWVRKEFATLREFAWQEGYGAFSVSRSNLDAVAQYIKNQKRHHEGISFEEEFVQLLKKHDIDYDERYIWG